VYFKQRLRMHKGRGNQLQYLRVPSIGIFIWLGGLLVLLCACSVFPSVSQTGGSSTSTLTSITPTQGTSPTPTATLAPINQQIIGPCPSNLASRWDSLVGTRTGINKVQKVMCGSLEGSGSVTAVVIARYYTPDAKMDFYVYDTLNGTPVRRFAVQGLVQGDARISQVNTIVTSQLVSKDPIPPNVFKEYQWNAASSSFVQVMFPGIYPDVTRYQAEQAQALATASAAQGKTYWQTSANTIVNKLASDIFHWSLTKTQTVTFNGSTATYIVQETNLGPGGGGFTAILFRLDNLVTNIFEISHITPLDTNARMSGPTTGMQLTSPASVSGTSQVTGSILGEVMFFDDTYTIIGDSGAIRSSVSSGLVNFSQSVKYHLSAAGLQEGIVAFISTNQNNTALSNQVAMVKVFFSA
jgi:hypothetical protein